MTWWHVCLLCPHRRWLRGLDIHWGCLYSRLLNRCLDNGLLERCLNIRLLGGDGHLLLARSLD